MSNLRKRDISKKAWRTRGIFPKKILRKYFTRYLPPSIRVKDHNIVKSNFEDRARDVQGLLGSSLMIPFCQGKSERTSQFKITRIID